MGPCLAFGEDHGDCDPIGGLEPVLLRNLRLSADLLARCSPGEDPGRLGEQRIELCSRSSLASETLDPTTELAGLEDPSHMIPFPAGPQEVQAPTLLSLGDPLPPTPSAVERQIRAPRHRTAKISETQLLEGLDGTLPALSPIEAHPGERTHPTRDEATLCVGPAPIAHSEVVAHKALLDVPDWIPAIADGARLEAKQPYLLGHGAVGQLCAEAREIEVAKKASEYRHHRCGEGPIRPPLQVLDDPSGGHRIHSGCA